MSIAIMATTVTYSPLIMLPAQLSMLPRPACPADNNDVIADCQFFVHALAAVVGVKLLSLQESPL